MKILVWSTNPVKINSVRLSAEKCIYFENDSIDVSWLSVPSWVSDQPLDISEVIQWAKNRAYNLKELWEIAEYYVGIEWGTTMIWDTAYLFWVTYIVNNRWEAHFAMTQSMEVPEYFRKWLYEEGRELWPMEDELNNIENVGQKNGSFGMWTDDMLGRQQSFENSFFCAIAPFYNRNYKL